MPGRWPRKLKPDVFCFCTPPNVRLPLIEIGIASGAKLIAFEKPVAMTSAEGLADQAGARQSRREGGRQPSAPLRRALPEGEGDHRERRDREGHTVYGTATGWAAHMLSHLVDYTSWFNDYEPAEWVMGQAAGPRQADGRHASPDYVAGVVHFQNGVRGVYDCGAGAPDVPEVPYWWRKCRIGAQGTEGYAEVHTGGGWRAVTKDGVQSGPGGMDYDHDMPPYVQEMADWLDDDPKPHPLQLRAGVSRLRDHVRALPIGHRGRPDRVAARRAASTRSRD